MSNEIERINQLAKERSAFVEPLFAEMGKNIVGRHDMLERMVIALLCRGHILLEGVPGLAKTFAVTTMSKALDLGFGRIQFTPDLLPADLIGTEIYNAKTGDFSIKKGPIFRNVILADEINRAPAKVQSALLEAMQEKQVSIGEETFKLEEPFIVLATQNPIEQEGTYQLPEAQVDRFMFKLLLTYPTREEEVEILKRQSQKHTAEINRVVSTQQIAEARELVDSIYVDDKVASYIVDLVFATREPESFGLPNLKSLIEYGASPRASIYLTHGAKARAFLNHRGYVTPDDVQSVAPDVLRHRILPTYEAEAEEMTSDDIIRKILDTVTVP